ncbi:MAG: CocE/NonD family hydrolase [Cyclobacteriaceae bacterium]|nr:CocE/NonD family hydrolase [Cyclobacteriaceae bacterium]
MRLPVSLLIFLLATQTLHAQNDTLTYQRKEVFITMRDGIRLNTVIWAPRVAEKLPMLLVRTPYGVSESDSPNRTMYFQELAREGYIFVLQDIRGRYKSEGRFEMQRMGRNKKDTKAIDESTDTWDAIDWLVRNVPGNSGKVGMLGISYAGWTTVQGFVDPHPALKVASEQATPSDMWMGDDFHHYGAFRLSYGFEYAFMEEAAKSDSLYPFPNYDTYDWYLKLGPLANVNKDIFHGKIPTWNHFAEHPDYDSFWQQQALTSRLDHPTVPTLHVAGWWDQEDFYGPLKCYEVLEKKDVSNMNHIVIGPWNHGGWGRGDGERLGNIRFGSPTSKTFRQDIQLPWFNFHLKSKGDGKFAEARTFQTGSNTWRTYAQWPPVSSKPTAFYFQADGKLSLQAPTAADASDRWLSDPARPVPYRPRPIEQTYGPGSRWYTWLVEDQRFVHNRPDVMSWETEVLTEDLTITGNVLANLFASTDGSDADWVVKLIDVYPANHKENPAMSGYQLMVANEVFRGRYRKSFEKPEALRPGEVNPFAIDLHQVNHVFTAGHKVMVQVQSSWFPLIDRNPQQFVPNIFNAKEADFIKANHAVHRSTRFPSHIVLPVER